MSFNGSGVFTINTAGQPVITGTTISSTTFNSLTADLATGLTTALTKDGQSTPTANIGMGAFKITNLAAGTVASDAARLDQVQGGAATFITVTGTDTLTGTTSPALAAYATGNQFSFVVANTNTGAVTINVDGIGSKAITRTGTTALVAGDMVAGQAVEIIYDGTRFQLVNGNSFTNLKVSGTLGVTGVATFTAQPIVSSLTASLPVFTDASKGLVSNTITGTGSVAMSASPTFTGTVGAAALTTTGNTILGNASTDTLNVGNGGLVKDASGNVGIGLTPSAWTDSIGVIQGIAGTYAISANGTNNNQFDLLSNAYRNGGTNTYLYFAGSNATRYQQVSGAHVWYTSVSGTTGGTITFLESMRITSTGNVGIGTASPSVSSGLGAVLNGGASQTRLAFKNTYTGDASGDGVQFALLSASSGFVFQNRESDGSFSWETNSIERMRIDSAGNTYVETGNLWQYSPAPTALAAGANAGTAAQLLGGMFSAAQTTAVTLTMPTGTAIDTGFSGVPAVDIGFYFYVINTGSALGAVTVAVNTNVTSLGSLVVAIGTSAQFRLRRTAANTYVMYRLS